MTDTIYALTTVPGRSGIAVVRVSGPAAFDSLRNLADQQSFPEIRHATLMSLTDPHSNLVIDHALVITFQNPSSFTGENCVEYHLHGSPAVVKMLLQALQKQPGHRLADPGEFTRRAFENGKVDLTGAEAIADLINAETELQQQQALGQLDGNLSRLYDGWRHDLSRALAHLEADLDFPDEDLPDGVASTIMPVIDKLVQSIADHLDDGRRGEIMRDGFHIAIIGAPNAGKSSLINTLAQRDIAIVSEHAGTTRDVIELHLNLGGYPVIIADTAGLRPEQLGTDSHGTIESEGIRRALERAKAADLKILMFDSTLPIKDEHTSALIDDRSIVVMNKTDISGNHVATDEIYISIRTGTGIDTLTKALIGKIEAMIAPASGRPSLTRQRYRNALKDCHQSLLRAQTQTMPELVAEDVRLAVRSLGRITGRVDVEDLLDIIFRDFCIGK